MKTCFETLASPVPAEIQSGQFSAAGFCQRCRSTVNCLGHRAVIRGEQFEPGIYSSGAWARLHAVTQHGANRLAEIVAIVNQLVEAALKWAEAVGSSPTDCQSLIDPERSRTD